jgi:hypothetical protein
MNQHWCRLMAFLDMELEKHYWKGWGMVFMPRSEKDYLT